MWSSRECKQIVFLLMLLGVLAGVQFRDRIRKFIVGEGYDAGFTGTGPSDVVMQDHNDLSGSFTAWRRPAPVPDDLNDPMALEWLRPVEEPNEPAQAVQTGPTPKGTPVRLGEGTPVFYVMGIVFSEDRPSSIILDDGILHQGDEIYGARVTDISRRSVTCSKEGRDYVVRVGEAPTDASGSVNR